MRQLTLCLFSLFIAVALPAQNDSIKHVSTQIVARDTLKVALNDTVKPEFAAFLDTGIASWYGHQWNGRMTASGEIFCPDSMTAAHKNLPFGTIVKVTNLSNDSVIYVRITDRLPKSSKRSIDLTPIAAKRLGFYSKGLQRVAMESVGKTPVVKKKRSQGGRKPPAN